MPVKFPSPNFTDENGNELPLSLTLNLSKLNVTPSPSSTPSSSKSSSKTTSRKKKEQKNANDNAEEGELSGLPIPPPLMLSPATPDYMKQEKIRKEWKRLKKLEEQKEIEKEKQRFSYITPVEPIELTPIDTSKMSQKHVSGNRRLSPPTPEHVDRNKSIYAYFNTQKKTDQMKRWNRYVAQMKTKKKRRQRKRRKNNDPQKQLVFEDTNEKQSKMKKRISSSPMMKRKKESKGNNRGNDNNNKNLPFFSFPKKKDGFKWEYKMGKFSSDRKLVPSYQLYSKTNEEYGLTFYEMKYDNADLRNVRAFEKSFGKKSLSSFIYK